MSDGLEPYWRWTKINDPEYGVSFYGRYQIKSIENNILTLYQPLTVDIKLYDEDMIWYIKEFPYIEEVGIQDVTIQGNYRREFVHHQTSISDGGWNLLVFGAVVNGWMHNIVLKNCNHCGYWETSTQSTVSNVILDGPRSHH
eukprot:UN33658